MVDLIVNEDDQELEQAIEDLVEDILLVDGQRYFFRSKVPKSLSLVNDLLPNFDERRFRSTIRMSRDSFYGIYMMLKDNDAFKQTKLPVIVQLLVVFYR
jgi:hypothetical protein